MRNFDKTFPYLATENPHVEIHMHVSFMVQEAFHLKARIFTDVVLEVNLGCNAETIGKYPTILKAKTAQASENDRIKFSRDLTLIFTITDNTQVELRKLVRPQVFQRSHPYFSYPQQPSTKALETSSSSKSLYLWFAK